MRSVSEDVESIWRQAYREAVASEFATTFYQSLDATHARFQRLNAAGSLSSVSKNSASQGYAIGSTSSRTSVDNERIALDALKLYESIRDGLSLTDETEIFNAGLLQLRSPCTEVLGDMRFLREVA